ncbi:MAG: hypothetical protein LC541_16370 [Candidatus Thiodiazotropha sp.]|nr:hypothetical protein [Candidatus Thiodiazotropha sp.]MCM8884848.1 hypothetical protein [Candidatus Thiodiazotropha sp.]MCM8920913.1 hypothetical protein [Candidatus Thiodiazotropha sp.]MCU7873422.1 hypothetical protein [Candidatus Thiodiazotropha sp. (ex Lucinoma borealis)]MCU7946017.1 hypothetical protein [Candidatus Thiodiazotropha sp. (ex Cardiolucina cf. quadrata)]
MQLRSLWLIILLIGCSGGDPTATDPTLIFKDGFENSLQEVDILADGGTMVRGFDAWLKIVPKLTTIHLRNAANYDYRECGELVVWFYKVTRDTNLQQLHNGLVCQESIDPRFKFDNGRWLLTDRSNGVAYYRTWKK